MKTNISMIAGMIAMVSVAASPGVSASVANETGTPTKMVVTVRPSKGGSGAETLAQNDLTVLQNKTRTPVIRLQRLTGDMSDMQLFVLLDDSTRSSSLGIHLPELKAFVNALPATTQVAIGYMRNGTFSLVQPFTTDHQQAAGALRLPESAPGENGSPYFALSDLVKHWPSKQATDRRAVLMFTDGVDRYYGASDIDDPYVDAAVHDSLKEGVLVYSIYLRGAGQYGRSGFLTNFAQSRLEEVSQKTGGYAYFQDLTDPVNIAPFLTDFRDRLNHQYQLTIEASNRKGVQPVKLRTEVPGLKIQGPTEIYVR